MKKERDASDTARRRIVLLTPVLQKILYAFQWLCITSIPIFNEVFTFEKAHIDIRNLKRGFRRPVLPCSAYLRLTFSPSFRPAFAQESPILPRGGLAMPRDCTASKSHSRRIVPLSTSSPRKFTRGANVRPIDSGTRGAAEGTRRGFPPQLRS